MLKAAGPWFKSKVGCVPPALQWAPLGFDPLFVQAADVKGTWNPRQGAKACSGCTSTPRE